MTNEYKVEKLRGICAEYINATAWQEEVSRMDRENKLFFYKEADASQTAWYLALRMACEAVGADMKKVIAFEKAVRRNTQYRNHWEHEPQISWGWFGAGTENSYRKAVVDTEGHLNYYGQKY